MTMLPLSRAWALRQRRGVHIPTLMFSYVCEGCHAASTANRSRAVADQWAIRHAAVQSANGRSRCQRFRFIMEVPMEGYQL